MVSNEPDRDATDVGRSETSQGPALQDSETLGLEEDISNGTWLETRWFGFHIHFNHACIQALIKLGGDKIVDLIANGCEGVPDSSGQDRRDPRAAAVGPDEADRPAVR